MLPALLIVLVLLVWAALSTKPRRLACTERIWARTRVQLIHTSQQARALYRGLWQTCSPGEQELLYEVALRRLVRSSRSGEGYP